MILILAGFEEIILMIKGRILGKIQKKPAFRNFI